MDANVGIHRTCHNELFGSVGRTKNPAKHYEEFVDAVTRAGIAFPTTHDRYCSQQPKSNPNTFITRGALHSKTRDFVCFSKNVRPVDESARLFEELLPFIKLVDNIPVGIKCVLPISKFPLPEK